MWMEVHINSVEAKSKAGNIWVKDNTKRPKPKENQLGILKIYAFSQKIQQRVLDPRVIGLPIYLREYTQKVATLSLKKLP